MTSDKPRENTSQNSARTSSN